MGRKTEIEALKRRYGRRLLKLPGVSGVGIERRGGDDDYELVVHVKENDAKTREAIEKAIGAKSVRIVKSGPFKKQNESGE